MKNFRAGSLMAILAFMALVIIPSMADARFGKSGGFGSRGSKTFSTPRATPTAPRAASPIQRTASPRTATAPRPGVTKPGLFGGMSKGGFMAGLLGAGLLGALFGYGLSGGLGGIGAFLGLILQIGLVAFAAMFLFSWFRQRNQPQPAMARSSSAPNRPYGSSDDARDVSGMARSSLAGDPRGNDAAGADGGRFATPTKPLATNEADFNAFERLLTDVQLAYAKEDMSALARIATQEMCEYFNEDIEDNKAQGHASRISGVKLLKGDLSEAWKERDAEYATVAMRFSLNDAIVDRVSGKVVEGSLTEPHEMTEIWTFVRKPGGSAQDWQLTAVQPVDEDENH